ncbi:MAG: formate dehydrogenase accessory sulfurtransferase FdhD [Spirosomataceae bacterium]
MQILRISPQQAQSLSDELAEEEPLEIVLRWQQDGVFSEQSLSVTMRTPGPDDADLALGFLFTEGLIQDAHDVVETKANPLTNRVFVTVIPAVSEGFHKLSRNFYTTSSCGVCGKTSLDFVRTTLRYSLPPSSPVIHSDLLYQLPQVLRQAQTNFSKTGGVHASGLFDLRGNLLMLREDVGRHNALDKLIGAAFRQQMLPLSNHILVLSGRISFELIQKALMAGIPIIVAVGAPSTLAIELATEHQQTVVGFLKETSLNLYSGRQRLQDVSILG